MAYTDKIDTSLPAGSDDPAEADDNMRRIQGGFQEILAVEHNVDLTGTEITGDGTHTDITPDSVTSSGPISGTTGTFSGTLDVTGITELIGVATIADESITKTTAAPTTDAMIANKKYVDDGGMKSIDGTPTQVFTKYLTGTLDSDSTTEVTHNIADHDKILSVTVICKGGADTYRVYDSQSGLSAGDAFYVLVKAATITITGVGGNVQGNAYRIRIDYIL